MPALLQSRGCSRLKKAETLSGKMLDFSRDCNSTDEAKPSLGDLQLRRSQEEFLASHTRRKGRRRTR